MKLAKAGPKAMTAANRAKDEARSPYSPAFVMAYVAEETHINCSCLAFGAGAGMNRSGRFKASSMLKGGL